jgi:hypothetical protein
VVVVVVEAGIHGIVHAVFFRHKQINNTRHNDKRMKMQRRQLGPRWGGRGCLLVVCVSVTTSGPQAPLPTYLYVVSCMCSPQLPT